MKSPICVGEIIIFPMGPTASPWKLHPLKHWTVTIGERGASWLAEFCCGRWKRDIPAKLISSCSMSTKFNGETKPLRRTGESRCVCWTLFAQWCKRKFLDSNEPTYLMHLVPSELHKEYREIPADTTHFLSLIVNDHADSGNSCFFALSYSSTIASSSISETEIIFFRFPHGFFTFTVPRPWV